jgi:hypothetical protein
VYDYDADINMKDGVSITLVDPYYSYQLRGVDARTINESLNLDEKAKSEIQQQAAGAALAAKRGEIPASELTGASKRMYDDMTEDQLEDFAGTKHDNVPHKVEEMFSEYRKRFSYVLKRSDTYPIITEGVRSTASGWDDIDKEMEKVKVSYVTVIFPSTLEKSITSKVKSYSEKNGYRAFQITKGKLHFAKYGEHIGKSEEQKLQREISKLVGMDINVEVKHTKGR